MDILVYALFSVFCFILLHHTLKRDELPPTVQSIELKLMVGFLFIVLGVMSLQIDYNLPNGSPSSYTPISETAISNMWQRGLVAVYLLFGLIQIPLAIMDSLEWRNNKRKEEENI